MLPSAVIHVCNQTRIVLCNRVQVVLIGIEIFVTASSAQTHAVVDVVVPINLERIRLSRLNRLRQVNAHHRLIHNVWQVFSSCICYFIELETTVEPRVQINEVVGLHLIANLHLLNLRGVVVFRVDVLIELNPQVIQHIRRVVVIGDNLFTVDFLNVVVQTNLHFIIDLLLPVVCSRSTARCAIGIRSGHFIGTQLTELIVPWIHLWLCKGVEEGNR